MRRSTTSRSTPTKTSAELPADGVLIWVGPPILYLEKLGKTFSARKAPKFIGRYIEQCPDVRKLFVSAEEFAAARREVRRLGSELHQAAEVVRKHFGPAR